MAISLLLLPIFASSKKNKKMSDNNKLVAIALFATTTKNKMKCDGNKLIVVAHFCFK